MRFLLLILFIAFFVSLFADEEVKIGIFAKYSLTEFEIQLADNARIFYMGKDKTLEKGKWNIKLKAGRLYFSNSSIKIQGEHILLRSKEVFTIAGLYNDKILSRSYKGSLELYVRNNRILLVLTLPLEEYVSSSTYAELGELLFDKSMTEKSKNALIASQEIVIRTFIRNEKRRHEKEVYDFCDLTHCIHFAGNINKLSIYPGEILTGKYSVNGYFHSTCGGKLTGPEVFWSKHEISPHYKRGSDGVEANCKNSPHFNWDTMLSTSELEEILDEENLISIQTETKNERVMSLKYTNSNQKQKGISIAAFSTKTGKLHGWNKIKSNNFTITKTGTHYRFQGHGLGHGIGLCQWGAKNLAVNGKSHLEILEFYFPGTELKK
jgi:SpoIID/LytB domain protein